MNFTSLIIFIVGAAFLAYVDEYVLYIKYESGIGRHIFHKILYMIWGAMLWTSLTQ